jgi:hypothetical protein
MIVWKGFNMGQDMLYWHFESERQGRERYPEDSFNPGLCSPSTFSFPVSRTDSPQGYSRKSELAVR